MESRVRELENEIALLKQELSAKSDFLSMVVHQLRTPLSAMKWTFKMMLDGDLGAISDTQRSVVERGLESSGQMIKMLADVSAANHAADWKLTMKPEPMDLTGCIKGTLKEFEEEAKGRNIALSYDAGELPKVLADREKICLVVENLMENAIKYNRANGSVAVRAERFGDSLVVSVTDTGMGIPLEEQPKLFAKFYRAGNARAREKGTGLGLYVGRQIIESHGGTIWFESVPDVGTTFFFSLPIAK